MIATRRLVKSGLKSLASLFLAQGCPVCDRPTAQTFCPDCQRQLQTGPVPAHLTSCQALPVSALGIYSGALKRAILALKYGDRPDVARPLGIALGQQWLAASDRQFRQSRRSPASDAQPRILYALPIPLHISRQQQRGYNQAELIAQAFCRVSGLPLLANGLTRTEATLPQHQLSLQARQHNLKQVFQVDKSLRRVCSAARAPEILLIDDIYTTGTTVQSAVDTLAQADVPVVGVTTLARAILSSPG
jgi:ComF family protein